MRRLALCFGIASLVSVGSGCIVANFAGIGSGVWARNVAAWAIGAALSQLVARLVPATLCRALLIVAPVSLLISLFSSGQAGVHRWIALGPLSWNVAFVLLPAASVAFAAMVRTAPRWTCFAALIIQAELCLQPDASQATAFAAAAAITLLTAPAPRHLGFAASIVLALGAALAWARPDPLAPVPEVEGIIELALTQSRGIAALCVTALAAVVVSPLVVRNHARFASIGLSVYLLVCTLMPLFGAFPVPLAGMGMSPIIGFWLAIGTLTSVCGRALASPHDERT